MSLVESEGIIKRAADIKLCLNKSGYDSVKLPTIREVLKKELGLKYARLKKVRDNSNTDLNLVKR